MEAAGDTVKRSGGRRLAWIAIALWLAVGVGVWNTVFDRGIQAAEERYMALQARHQPSVTIRGVMDPAIHDAAVTATWWAAVPLAAGLVGVLLIARRARARLTVRENPSCRVP